jgi:hypothetical protein
MNNLRIRNVPKADINIGEFNNCEHLFLQIEPGKWQTISCRLPNGKFVTFAFVPTATEEIECVDIHTTAGVRFKNRNGDFSHQQNVIGFRCGSNSFDTRRIEPHTSLITLLLHSNHNTTDNHPSESK